MSSIKLKRGRVSEALPASWMFIQGGLFILVVTALPEGVLGWIRKGGLKKLLFLIGINKKLETYPSLEVNEQGEVKS